LWETDYLREAKATKVIFLHSTSLRSVCFSDSWIQKMKHLLSDEDIFVIPSVIDELSSERGFFEPNPSSVQFVNTQPRPS